MVVRVNEAEVMRQLKEVRSKSKYEAERLRAHIIISATSLRSKAEVSRVVGCSRTTVQKAVKMFDAGGVSELRDRRRENVCRPIKERAKILDLLPNLVSKQPGELGVDAVDMDSGVGGFGGGTTAGHQSESQPHGHAAERGGLSPGAAKDDDCEGA